MSGKSPSALQTFDIASWSDMFAKLKREFERIKQTDDRDDLVDHSFNFAVTA